MTKDEIITSQQMWERIAWRIVYHGPDWMVYRWPGFILYPAIRLAYR